MPGAATDGDYFAPPPIGEWNDIRESARNRRIGSGARKVLLPTPIDRLQLKNTTGSQLAIGRVLQVGSAILTPWDPDNQWFNGSSPSPDGTDEIAVALNPVPSNDYDWFQGVGYCLAQVNIIHEQHPYADVDSGSTLLQSKWHGRAKIVKKFASGTGEKQCLVRLGEMFRGPLHGVITESGGIAMNDHGEVTVYRNGSAMTGTGSTVDAYYNWIYAADLPEDQRVTFDWLDDQQKYVIRTPWC